MQCKKCNKLTLHEQDPDPVNHVLHLLVTVLLLGLWLPVWLLIAITGPVRYMRCLACGYSAGEDMEETYREYEKSQREEAARAWGKRFRSLGKRFRSWIFAAARLSLLMLSGIRSGFAVMIEAIDSPMRRVADADVFMLWMLRTMVVIAILTSFSFGVYFASRAIGLV